MPASADEFRRARRALATTRPRLDRYGLHRSDTTGTSLGRLSDQVKEGRTPRIRPQPAARTGECGPCSRFRNAPIMAHGPGRHPPSIPVAAETDSENDGHLPFGVRCRSVDDRVACTDDACLEGVGVTTTPNDANCTDGSKCNGVETGNALDDCQPARNAGRRGRWRRVHHRLVRGGRGRGASPGRRPVRRRGRLHGRQLRCAARMRERPGSPLRRQQRA